MNVELRNYNVDSLELKEAVKTGKKPEIDEVEPIYWFHAGVTIGFVN